MKLLNTFLNIRTLGILIIGFLASFVAIHYQIKMHQNMVLFGLIISFPLVFSLQAAFKRREKALEYLGLFKGAFSAVEESFQMSKKLSDPNKLQVQQFMVKANGEFINYLQTGIALQDDVYLNFKNISSFMFTYREEMSTKAMFRITRYMKDVYNCVSYLMSLKTHRTINILRIFSNIFIGLFPILQACLLVNAFGDEESHILIYSISIITSIILGTLLQIQHQLEDPFDQDGIDDIRLDEFSFTEKK